MSEKTLITGASGYLGQLAALELLKGTGGPVVMLVHADDAAEAEAKITRLKPQYAGFEHLMEWTWGALEADDPFWGVDPRTIARIVHAAAIYRFDIDAQTAATVNVGGTRKLLDFSERCPGLAHVCLVSSLYASGLQDGVIAEERLPFDAEAPFTNHYERSKHLSEEILLERPHLPWSIARVGLVIADDDTGHVTQYNAFHFTLKLFHHGLMSVFPGDPENRVYFVTGAFVAQALADIIRLNAPQRIFHVVHREADGVSLSEAIDLAFDALMADPRFRARRLPRPMFIDQDGFDVLVSGMANLGSRVQVQTLNKVASFARQMYVRKDARNENLLAVLSQDPSTDQRALLSRVCAHLVRTQFGKIE
jgi:thioester reductase-like protein